MLSSATPNAMVSMAKVAVTLFGAFMTTRQEGPGPLQAPLQPEKVEPEPGVAVSVTLVPLAKGAPHDAPQLIPLGDEVTVPMPLPVLLTDSEKAEPAFSH